MAERVQLKDPGSELVMLVSLVKPETVEKNDYYLFTNGQKELLVPQSSIKAQLERLGITGVEQMNGKNVRFARSMKMSRANKPFWDIDWASGAEQSVGGEAGALPKPAGSASAPPPSTDHPPVEKLKLTDIYMTSSKFVIDKIVPLYVQADIGCSDQAVASMVATLFIAASRER